MGTHLKVLSENFLSNEYQHDRFYMIFHNLLLFFVLNENSVSSRRFKPFAYRVCTLPDNFENNPSN